MVEFNEENVKMMSHQAKGRTILSMSLERSADDFLIITFMDGARLRIRYDYIWDLEIIKGRNRGKVEVVLPATPKRKVLVEPGSIKRYPVQIKEDS